jgi:hypothetical protein
MYICIDSALIMHTCAQWDSISASVSASPLCRQPLWTRPPSPSPYKLYRHLCHVLRTRCSDRERGAVVTTRTRSYGCSKKDDLLTRCEHKRLHNIDKEGRERGTFKLNKVVAWWTVVQGPFHLGVYVLRSPQRTRRQTHAWQDRQKGNRMMFYWASYKDESYAVEISTHVREAVNTTPVYIILDTLVVLTMHRIDRHAWNIDWVAVWQRASPSSGLARTMYQKLLRTVKWEVLASSEALSTLRH